jgi:membrane-associated phospholipid phosphatase
MGKKVIILILLLLPMSLFAQNLDTRILKTIYSPHPLVTDKFFLFTSNYSVYAIIGTPVVMGTVGLIKHDDELFRNACVTVAGSALSVGITVGLKYAVNRKRPDQSNIGVVDKSSFQDPSFPSGHASSAFSTATSLSLAYPKWYVIAPAYTIAGTISYGRVYLGGHYPSDVLAGALIGTGSSWLTWHINKKLQEKAKKTRQNY